MVKKNDRKVKSKTSKKNSKGKSKEPNVEETYVHLDHHDHVLLRPDTYVGSLKSDLRKMFVYTEEDKQMKFEEVSYNQGLYKIFDEIIVNARDRTVLEKCDTIKVEIDQEAGSISVWNNGLGVPVKFHKTEKVYVPQLIFGTLLTSENYKTTKKTTGGKNGYGAKCTNIFSKEFIVETVDSREAKKYVQVFSNNMYDIAEPKITKNTSSEGYCKITFTPDYNRFGMTGMSDDMYNIFVKRCYDLLVTSSKKVNVYLNKKKLKIKSFEQYIKLYYPKMKLSNIIYKKFNKNWKVGVVFRKDGGYAHVSFVNGIYTVGGGTHVEMITNQIVKGITAEINSRPKYKDLKIRPALIRDNIHVFIDSVIEDPDFESQTKEVLKTKRSDYGSGKNATCKLDKEFIKELLDSGLDDHIIKYAEFKQNKDAQKSDGSKTKNVNDANLDDANWAGTGKSLQCRLFITEGDSAKTFAIHGLSVIGRDRYGAFPIRGKFLNLKTAAQKQIIANKELKAIKKAVGLKEEETYETETDLKKLRYGGLIFLTDQDVDGSHIKGLLINAIATKWPYLCKHKGFIQTMNTPIIKATQKGSRKKPKIEIFYTIPEFKQWRKKREKDTGSNHISKWDVHYYKGLGTSEEDEARECFQDFEKKILSYVETSSTEKKKKDKKKSKSKGKKKGKDTDEDNDEDSLAIDDLEPLSPRTSKAIDLAFSGNFKTERKGWISNYKPNEVLEYDGSQTVTYEEFVHKDLKHFSVYDCTRSLPSLMDGFKPSHRKILYAGFKRGRNAGKIKVSQFAGKVAEWTEYHHNEDALKDTITGMGRKYTGSNNINFFYPSGNFGTRYGTVDGIGKDAANARYIFTYLEKITSKIFRQEDECILKFIVEDNMTIEPEFYAPIIPTVLVNGTSGIGTGYSSKIPCYNPLDLVENIKRLIAEKKPKSMKPWYKGFTGTIVKDPDPKYKQRYISSGRFAVEGTTVTILELPISTSMSISKYKAYLEKLRPKKRDDKDAKIVDFVNNSTANTPHFTIEFKKTDLQKLIRHNYRDLKKLLKIDEYIHTSNMTLYNAEKTVRKYADTSEIMNEYYTQRYKMYEERKAFYVEDLKNKLNIIDWKIKYINDVIDDKIIVKKRSMEKLIKRLEELKYPRLHKDHTVKEEDRNYNYLLDMRITSMTTDKIAELEEERKKRKKDLKDYQKITIEELWTRELDEFAEVYKEWVKADLETLAKNSKPSGKKGKMKVKGKARKVTRRRR